MSQPTATQAVRSDRSDAPPARKVSLPVLASSGPAAVLDEQLTLPAEPLLPDDVPRLEGRPEGTGPQRTSSYTIYVDLPDDPESMLLVHTYSGAYDRVSRRVATYLRAHEAGHAPKPLYGTWSPEPRVDGEVAAPADETIARLRKRGYLTRLSVAEEEAYFAHVASRLHHASVRGRPGYILMPTYQCNLRCAYCFQDHMRTDPAYAHLLRAMTPAMVDRIWRGMERIEAAHGIAPEARGPRDLTLFGGEPLLAENRAVIDSIFAKAAQTGGARFGAVTNATELDAYADLIGPDGIAFLQVTLDGPPAEHDRRRIYADGSGSFERIAANVTMALERGARVSLRMNVDRGNVDSLPALAEEYERRGWDRSSLFSAYVAAVHAVNENVDDADTFDTWKLRGAVAALRERFPAMKILGSEDDGLASTVRGIFEQRSDPMPSFRGSFCGAHSTMYVIDAFGDIYACWERTGAPSVRIGAVEESGDVRMNAATFRRWRSRSVVSNEVCRRCRYATWCGGGCAVQAEEHHGHIFGNHCDGFAKRFRASVASTYRDFVNRVVPERSAARVCDM
jgi:uncharacterized protein